MKRSILVATIVASSAWAAPDGGLPPGNMYGDSLGAGLVDAPVHKGSLPKEAIRQVIHINRNAIRACYESAIEKEPTLETKVKVQFVVGTDGNVASAEIDSGSGRADFDQCITGAVKKFVFPVPKGGGTVKVTYPFVFKQGAPDGGTPSTPLH